jgi:SAM-dependent methyltransferase
MLTTFVQSIYRRLSPERTKEQHELSFWKSRLANEGVLGNSHYEYFFTSFFGFDHEFYRGKRLLDVGCGPRGSLEWAFMASERVGLDPLAGKYRKLGIGRHKMTYVSRRSDDIPFPNGYFDVVTAFNSLDHVDDFTGTTEEIQRVLRPGGVFLLIVEVEHQPTSTEPITLHWNTADCFSGFDLIEARKYEIGNVHDIYGQLKSNARFDENNPEQRPGILAAKFMKDDSRRITSQLPLATPLPG